MGLTATPNVCLIYIRTQHSAAWVLARNKQERGVIPKAAGACVHLHCGICCTFTTPLLRPRVHLLFEDMQKMDGTSLGNYFGVAGT